MAVAENVATWLSDCHVGDYVPAAVQAVLHDGGEIICNDFHFYL